VRSSIGECLYCLRQPLGGLGNRGTFSFYFFSLIALVERNKRKLEAATA